MSWTTPADLRAQVQRLWDKGDLLAGLVSGEDIFPRRLVLKSPTSAEISERFDDVRTWIAELRSALHYRVTTREVRHRIFGTNALPDQVWLDHQDSALALIGKKRDAMRFAGMIATTRARQPKLLGWLARRPLQALELSGEWGRLLEIVSWVEAHPRPGVYLRQVDIPGVHTKFIETYRGVLTELLDLTLPSDTIDSAISGLGQFAQRYGFKDKPLRIRFRVLDPKHTLMSAGPEQDITLDASTFSQLNAAISKVFITENEINFLAFPEVKNSMVIFGSGYGFGMFKAALWLKHCLIYYWGDIDTHGFAILDQLRSQFNHVESFLMNRATFLAFKPQWGEESTQTLKDLSRLNFEERALYDDLRDNRLGNRLRLEQEKIGFEWVKSALSEHFQP